MDCSEVKYVSYTYVLYAFVYVSMRQYPSTLIPHVQNKTLVRDLCRTKYRVNPVHDTEVNSRRYLVANVVRFLKIQKLKFFLCDFYAALHQLAE